MNVLPQLICAYLDSEADAAEVLNDALEELGMQRVAKTGTVSERLSEVLQFAIPRQQAEQLAVEFAANVLSVCDSPAAAGMIDAKRKIAADATQLDEHAMTLAMRELGWEEDNSPKSNAAWAIGTVLIASPRHVAAAAQRSRTDELAWQIAFTKTFLMS